MHPATRGHNQEPVGYASGNSKTNPTRFNIFNSHDALGLIWCLLDGNVVIQIISVWLDKAPNTSSKLFVHCSCSHLSTPTPKLVFKSLLPSLPPQKKRCNLQCQKFCTQRRYALPGRFHHPTSPGIFARRDDHPAGAVVVLGALWHLGKAWRKDLSDGYAMLRHPSLTYVMCSIQWYSLI